MLNVSIFRAAAWAGLMTLAAGMQTAFAAPLIYVPLGSKGKIVVVDAAKDEVVDKIDGVAAVHGLAGTPDGQFLVAGSFEEREPGSEEVVKPAGVSEDEHAAHHTGTDTASAEDGSVVSTVSIIRAADGTLIRRIDVPGAVHHVAVSPDSRFAVVTHPNEGSISAIDLTTYQVIATVSTGALTNYAAFGPDGKWLYVSNAGNDTVSGLDTSQWSVEWTLDVGVSPEHVVLSKDGANLYVNNVDDGTVSVVDVKDRRVARTIPIGTDLHGIDLSDDGNTLFVAARGDDKLIAVDLRTGGDRRVSLTPMPYHLSAIRGTGKLYVSSADEPKIWVVDQAGLKVLAEILIGGKGHQIVQGLGG